jgi:hypothetical protein
MSSSRPKLTFDEQSFQDMLAAAFTIQEHNAKRKRALPPEHVCGQCGAPVKEDELLCGRCAEEELRPGEQLQRKWASLWLMSQEKGLWPERSTAAQSDAQDETITAEVQALHVPAIHVPDPSETPDRTQETAELGDFADALEIPDPAGETTGLTDAEVEREWRGAALERVRPVSQASLLNPDVESPLPEINDEETTATPWNLRDLRLRLRFHRADLYLVVAIVVSTFAMIWVLSATPAAGAQRKPRLRPWERALVSLGLADAPDPSPRRGNPNIQVWVDPKTALYYCVGEELYGKAPGGHATTQREAQMDQFEPAGRAACE